MDAEKQYLINIVRSEYSSEMVNLCEDGAYVPTLEEVDEVRSKWISKVRSIRFGFYETVRVKIDEGLNGNPINEK